MYVECCSTKKKERANKAIKLTLAHTNQMTKDVENIVVQQSPDQYESVTDEATFPTEDNGNSHSESFASVAKKMADKEKVSEKPEKSFHYARDSTAYSDNFSDEDTVVSGVDNIKVSFIISVPAKDVDKDEAPLLAIWKLNDITKIK